MPNKSSVNVITADLPSWCPPVETPNLVTCTRCGYSWDYRGVRLLVSCTSCGLKTVTRPDPFVDIRVKKETRHTVVCEYCGHKASVERRMASHRCRSCGKYMYFRDKRPPGLESKIAIGILRTLKESPKNTMEVAITLGNTRTSIASSLKEFLIPKGLVKPLKKQMEIRDFGTHKRAIPVRKFMITQSGLKHLDKFTKES